MLEVSDENSVLDLELNSPEVSRCPYPHYVALHERNIRVKPEPSIGYAITGYEEVQNVAKDPITFSSTWQGADGQDMMGVSTEPYSDDVKSLIAQYPFPMPNTLLVADGPAHARQRVLVSKALNGQFVRAMTPAIEKIIHDLIDSFIDAGRCEFMSQFAEPIPSTVISDALGIAREDVPRFKRYSEAFILGLIEPIDNVQRVEVARTIIEYQNFMAGLLQERRERPREDLLSAMVNAELDLEGEDAGIEGLRNLTDAEILGMLCQLVAGGHHTTAGLIGNGLMILLEQPDVMDALRSDLDLIPNFIEEVLRYDPPIQCTFRRVTADTDVSGQDIAEGTILATMWGAANQDHLTFENPRTFDPKRKHVRRHLAFGQGTHFCIGAGLARLDSRIAFEALLTRLDDIKFAADEKVERHVSFASSSYKRIPITFRKSG